jgi:hypothetical protein
MTAAESRIHVSLLKRNILPVMAIFYGVFDVDLFFLHSKFDCGESVRLGIRSKRKTIHARKLREKMEDRI